MVREISSGGSYDGNRWGDTGFGRRFADREVRIIGVGYDIWLIRISVFYVVDFHCPRLLCGG